MLGDERLKLRNHLAALAEREVGLEPVLECRKAKLLQPGDLRRDGVLVEDILERLAPPESERLPEYLPRPCRMVPEHRPRRARETFETGRIELVGVDPKHVARRTRH
jgi:hypothetical protein